MTANSTLVRGAFLALAVTLAAPAAAKGGWQHYVTGNPADVVAPTSGLYVLQGGGLAVDHNFVAMGANMGGGDFVVLQAKFADTSWNDYIYALCGCDSVETIVFKNSQSAFDPDVNDIIRNAEAVFITGGDQSRYVEWWKNTPVEDSINFVASKPAPIGGTSAGLAIMTEFLYSATGTASLSSSDALQDPFNPNLTLDRDFLALPQLEDEIADSHFIERDRMGRTLAFLARLVKDGWATVAGAVAVDRETALHVDPATGYAEVFAIPTHPTPFVYFLRTPGQPEVCEAGTPLTYRDVSVYRIGPGGSFDLGLWQGSGGISYTVTAENGVLSSSRTDIY